jgi:hypothetical protein
VSDPGTSKAAEKSRIDFTGTVWFGATLIAAAIPLGALLNTGWRPGDLPVPNAIVWWIGAGLLTVGIFGLGWAGCPVLFVDFDTDHYWKSIAMRGGLSIFGIGAVASLLAVLLSPAA